MHIYLKNNDPAKFHLNQIWNGGVLDYFEERRPNKTKNNKNKMSSDMASLSAPKQDVKMWFHRWIKLDYYFQIGSGQIT